MAITGGVDRHTDLAHLAKRPLLNGKLKVGIRGRDGRPFPGQGGANPTRTPFARPPGRLLQNNEFSHRLQVAHGKRRRRFRREAGYLCPVTLCRDKPPGRRFAQAAPPSTGDRPWLGAGATGSQAIPCPPRPASLRAHQTWESCRHESKATTIPVPPAPFGHDILCSPNRAWRNGRWLCWHSLADGSQSASYGYQWQSARGKSPENSQAP